MRFDWAVACASAGLVHNGTIFVSGVRSNDNDSFSCCEAYMVGIDMWQFAAVGEAVETSNYLMFSGLFGLPSPLANFRRANGNTKETDNA